MRTFFREYSLITAFILVAMIGYLQLGEHQRELLAYVQDMAQRPFAAQSNDAPLAPDPFRQPPLVATPDDPPTERTPMDRMESDVVAIAVAPTEVAEQIDDRHVGLQDPPPKRQRETFARLAPMPVDVPELEPTTLTSPTPREASAPEVAEEAVEIPDIPRRPAPSITMGRPRVGRVPMFGRRGVSRGRRG